MKISTTPGPSALVITKLRTTTEWRTELDRRLTDAQNPAAVRLRVMRDVVDEYVRTNGSDPDERGMLPSAEFYSVYPTWHLLPKHFWVVGWIDEAGYRHVADTLPVPGEEFLDTEWAKVCEMFLPDPTFVELEQEPLDASIEVAIEDTVRQVIAEQRGRARD